MNKSVKPFTIFIVDDDIGYLEILEHQLSLNPDYLIKKYTSGEELLKNMDKKPNAICLDYNLPDLNGKEILKRLKHSYSNTPVVVISGQEDVQTAIDILQDENVYDYLIKDDDTKDRLWKSMMKIREKSLLMDEVSDLKEKLGEKYDFNQAIIGKSEAIHNIYKIMQKACDNNITVSVTGETGTGKELVVRCIHYNSQRSKKPFVAVNMNAIPNELIESELFGHEKGAFTGAQTRRIGKFEEANKGTIFLDEIADMDLSMQSKLLRVLQEREVTRIGSNINVKIDIRLIVATHKDLREEVKNGKFREDLYYRLLGLSIELPPLRERKEDILLLANFFNEAFCKENKNAKVSFSKEAKMKLSSYHYPGNIRELKAIVELSVVMADGDVIEEKDIIFNSNVSFTDFITEENTLKGYTSKIIRHYLNKNNEDVALVAKKLDVGKSTLYKMIQRGEV